MIRNYFLSGQTKFLWLIDNFRQQGENADENEAQLDEEMEKVFSEPNLSKFDVRKLSDVKPPSSSKADNDYPQSQQPLNANKYNEQDFDCKFVSIDMLLLIFIVILLSAHRKTSYPQPHAPAKAARSMNRQTSKDSNPTSTKKESAETPNSPISGGSDSDGEGYGNDTVSRPSNFSSYADYTSRDVSEDIEDEDPPPLSERVGTTHHDDVNIH